MMRSNIIPYNDKVEYIRFLTRFVLHHGYLRGTLKKISAFFTKKIIVTTIDEGSKKAINEILESFDYMTIQFNTIFNMFIYDQAILMHIPKQNISVKCPKCKTEYAINNKYPYSFSLQYLDDMYHIDGRIKQDSGLPPEERKLYARAIGIESTCTHCGTEHVSSPKVEWDFRANGVLKLMNPLWCDVYQNDAGKQYLRVNPDNYDGILDMTIPLRHYHIEGLTWDLICCFAGRDRYFVPNNEYYEIFSMEEISALGSGRSVSTLISAVSDLLHIDILKLGNEGIALSKVNPLYMLTPTDPSGNGAFSLVDQENFKDFMLQEVKEHAQGDINRLIYSPVPVNAIPMFGDGKKFLALQELTHFQANVITSLGFSPDVLNGTTGIINEPFNLSSMEILLNSFQTKFSRLIDNTLKKKHGTYAKDKADSKTGKLFIMEKIGAAKGGLDYNVKLDLIRQNILPMSMLVEDLGYSSLQYWESVMKEEGIQKYKNDMKTQQEMAKIDQNLMMASQDSQVATGKVDTTAAIYQLDQEAEMHIQQLSAMAESGQRKSYLNQIKNENPTLYYIVIGKWREFKQFNNTQSQYSEEPTAV